MSQIPIPPRPDIPAAPRRRRRWRVPVALLVTWLAAVGAAYAIEESVTVLPERPPAGAPGPPDTRTHRFFETNADGSPVRWNPCEPVTYRLYLHDAPAWAERDAQEAFRRLSVETGIRFLPLAPSRAPGLRLRAMANRAKYLRADIAIVWLPSTRFKALRSDLKVGPAIAFAQPFRGLGQHRNRYERGLVVIGERAMRPRGFGSWWAHGVTLMHEFGHVIGLAHVRDADQIMYDGLAPDRDRTMWGSGDREGFGQLGRQAGCLRD